MSIKSMGSSIHTEPTLEATFSDSTRSRSYDTLSEKRKRLQATRCKLQRFSDEHSESSTIRSDTLHRSLSNKMNESSLLESSQDSSFDEDTIQEGFIKSNNADEGGDVLRILRMLEQVSGYDLSLFESSLDERTILDLDLSFLQP